MDGFILLGVAYIVCSIFCLGEALKITIKG
mgnify:CR=1 FL=1